MGNQKIVITDCALLKPDLTIVYDQDVVIEDDKITAIRDAGQVAMDATIIKGDGKLVMPGLVDAHTHVCQQLLRGRTLDEYPMVWARILVPYESNLTPEDVYWSTKLACLEKIKAGTTAFADSGGRYMEQAIEAVAESGMRASITRSTADMGSMMPDNMLASAEANLQATEELYKKYHGFADGRINIWFGLRSIMSCSTELITQTAELARRYQTGVHMHLAEHRDEVSYYLQRYQMRPTEYLEELGLLGPNLLTAHNVLLSEPELELIKKYDVKVVHCPRSNFGNHGFPKTPRILQLGISVGLGSDGAAASSLSLFDELRVFRSGLHAFWGLPYFDPVVVPAQELIKMVTYGGANSLLLADQIGSVEIGKKADLITLNINQPHLYPTHNLLNTLVEAATAGDVNDVIINGRVVMKDRNVLTLDEEKIMGEAKTRLLKIAKRANLN